MVSQILVGIVTVIVAGIIGFVILDTIVADTLIYDVNINESDVLVGNITTYTLTNTPVITGTTTPRGNGTVAACETNMVDGTNFTVSLTTGVVSVLIYDNTTCGQTMLTNYGSQGGGYFTSSLSRTILSYIVPLGLLALIAIVAVLSL